MEIVNITPRGFCYGVVDAMVIAHNAAFDENLPRPIYILGMIVHNKHITESLKEIGIYTIDGDNRKEMLDKINFGTVIFTAHGISPKIVRLAKEKGLRTIDACCPDVKITHDLIKKYVDDGYEIIYIGKKNHPEPEGAIGVAPGKVHLLAKLEEIALLSLTSEKLFVTNQTTMSQWDVAKIMEALKSKYPQMIIHKEICHATQIRQKAVVKQAKKSDLTLVIGDSRSNNTNRLVQISIEQAHVPAKRIADLSELNIEWLKDVEKIAITAGASTPTAIIREVVKFLEQFDNNQPETWEKNAKITSEDILLKVRKKKDLAANRVKKMQKLRVKNGLVNF
ncbi:MAG: 4-hydroxy-3-methylbut-2-enyl diphosphate reductase [Streptococcaceae bacterium]|jgi:4-hydroxy-3-methylbut-2-enyl diphosphate reductase|nr:4-hydroxy-3-methylbut-2-enyl diphosphate reductase [Streptococcaceae bacterium]